MCPFDDEDPTLVKPKAIALWYAHQGVVAERDALAARVLELERQLAAKNKRLFGPSSERSKPTTTEPPTADAAQSTSGDGAQGQGEPAVAPPGQGQGEPAMAPPGPPPHNEGGKGSKEGKGHGRRRQPHLEVVEREHTLGPDQRTCGVCGGELEQWAGQEQRAREVDVVHKRYVVVEHVRRKYRCRCGSCIQTAPAPEKLKEGSAYSIGFGVDVAVEKYGDGLALETQAKAMGRSGLLVDSQTLWDQVDTVAFWCIGAYRALRDDVLSHMVVGVDETTWRLMTNKKGQTGSERWWIWLARVRDAVYYTFEDSRSADAGGKLLDDFEGVVMCDGYAAYRALRDRNPLMLLAHCWSHRRRDYVELETSYPTQAKRMVELMGELFAIEREVKDADLKSRLKVRKERCPAVLEQIVALAWEIGLSHSPQSRLYVVTSTLAQQWEGLTLFMRDARIPLHNNDGEQSARGPVRGRKIHQGSRSKRGTEVSAILYTLVESAKLSGVEPRAYLHLTVLRALRGLAPVLPHEVSASMLMETLSMSEGMAHALVRGRPERVGQEVGAS